MTERRSVLLGAAPVQVSIDGPDLVERFDQRYGIEGKAQTDPGAGWAPEVSLLLRSSQGSTLLDTAWQPELQSRREGDRLVMEWPGATGSFDLRSRTGEFDVRTDLRGFGLSLDDLLRVIGVELALRDGVLLLHAAAVGPANAEWVDIFAGRSDAGKTTLTDRLVARGETAISDDLVFVTVRDGRATALPTPFKGATRAALLRRRPASIRSLSFLRQDSRPSCRCLGGPEKLVRTLAATVRYRPLDPAETRRIAELAAVLVGHVPATELRLTLEADPRELLDGAVLDAASSDF